MGTTNFDIEQYDKIERPIGKLQNLRQFSSKYSISSCVYLLPVKAQCQFVAVEQCRYLASSQATLGLHSVLWA